MRGRHVSVTDRGETIVLRGTRVVEIARHAGLRPVYNGVAQGWVTDACRLGDLLAYCDSRHIAVEVERSPVAATMPRLARATVEAGGTRSTDSGDLVKPSTAEPEWDLFGGEEA